MHKRTTIVCEAYQGVIQMINAAHTHWTSSQVYGGNKTSIVSLTSIYCVYTVQYDNAAKTIQAKIDINHRAGVAFREHRCLIQSKQKDK